MFKRRLSILAALFGLVATLLPAAAGTVLAATGDIGNDDSARTQVDTYTNFVIVDTNNPASVAGQVGSFDYYAANTNTLRFLFVDAANKVTWVSDPITPSGVGSHHYVPSTSPTVTVGSNLGVYSANTGVIPFEYVGAPSRWQADNSGLPSVGDTLTYASTTQGRTYSMVAHLGCGSVCYAQAVGGSDSNPGTSTLPKKTIQAAIDAVDAGGHVRVRPGAYDETATNRDPASLPGPATYQFGLFFGADKPGITLMGVTSLDVPITDASLTQATITTNATNDFGTDGIFVEAQDTTIQGVKIGKNIPGDNKTIEVVGDNFTLRYSTTDIPGGGGSIYIDDFSAGGTVVKAYHVLDNIFPDGTSVDISSGAGNTGSVSTREILRNAFDLVNNGFNAISFNGTGGPPWFANPVGGAVIKNNSFKNSTQYIRARGIYTESEFDWASYWNDNTFDKAAVALITESPFDVRPYTYTTADPYTFTNVRRIGGTIQGEIQDGAVIHAHAGDTVLVKKGSYPESVLADRKLTIKGAQAGADCTARTFAASSESTITGQLTISGTDVTFDGFSLTNPGQTIGILVKSTGNAATIKYNILDTIGGASVSPNVQAVYLQSGPDDISIVRNCINNIQGVPTTKAIYSGDSNASNPSNNLSIKNNTISKISSASGGAYGIQINNGNGSTSNTGLLIDANTIDNLTGGGWAHAIGLEANTPGVIVTHNVVTNISSPGADNVGVWFESNPTYPSARVNFNSLAVGSTKFGIRVHPALSGGSADGTCNWWGSVTGPGGVGPGSGSLVGPNVTFSPWLLGPDLQNSPCAAPVKQLTLTKSASPATYSAVNQTISYSYKVENTGNVRLAGPVSVADDKATVSCPNVNTVGNTDAYLDPGESITCSASYLTTQADLNNGSVTNKATATADGTTSNQDSKTVTAVQNKQLSLVKSTTATGFNAVGQMLPYKLVATNTGNVTLTAVTITDPKLGALTCTPTQPATLIPGATLTCTGSHTVTQADLDAGKVTNTGHVKGTAPDGSAVDKDSNTVVVNGSQTNSLSLEKKANQTTFKKAGDVITYTYTVKNTGNTTLPVPITITDDHIGTFICSSAQLAPGATVTCTKTYTITKADVKEGKVTNKAIAKAGTTTSNTASATVKAKDGDGKGDGDDKGDGKGGGDGKGDGNSNGGNHGGGGSDGGGH